MSITPMGMYPDWRGYSNQVELNDLTDMSLYPYNPMGTMNPMMGMNGSIFGGAMQYPMMPGMGMGYPGTPVMGGMYGGSPEDYYKNYEKYQDFMINTQVRQQQKMRNADLRLNSPEEGISKQAQILREKIIQNEQEQIIHAMEAFKESIRQMYGDASDDQVTNRAMSLYAQFFGNTIQDDLRRYGNTSFKQGFKQTLTLGLADKKTAEQNISALTGQPVSRYENGKKVAGNIAGGAALGAGAAITANLLFKKSGKGLHTKISSPFFKTLFKSKSAVASAIGAVIGIGAAVATSNS